MARVVALAISFAGILTLSISLHSQSSDCPLEFDWNMWEDKFYLPAHCTSNNEEVSFDPVAIPDIPIHRLRFSIRTCDKIFAGTSHSTWVKINGIRMFLNRPGRDQRRKKTRYYTMIRRQVAGNEIKRIGKIGQIKDIRIGKTYYPGKKDDWCISQFQIKLNNSRYFFFKKRWKKGLWLNNHRRQIKIRNDEIEGFYRNNHEAFKQYNLYGQLPIIHIEPDFEAEEAVATFKGKILLTNYILREYALSVMGDKIHGRNNYSDLPKSDRKHIKWGRRHGRRYVDILPAVYYKPIIPGVWYRKITSRKNLNIDFDLKGVVSYSPDVSVDFDFNLNPRCPKSIDEDTGKEKWKIEFNISHLKMKTRLKGINIDWLVKRFGNLDLEKLLAAINAESFQVDIQEPIGNLLKVAETTGNVRLGFQCPSFKIIHGKHLLIEWN